VVIRRKENAEVQARFAVSKEAVNFRPMRRLTLLLLACVPLHANYIDFWIQNTLLHNIQPDRYKDSGIIMGTASPGGLCIGDVVMG